MRTLAGLSLLLCSCQLLPQKEVLCTDSDRCGPSPSATSVSSAFVLGQPDEKSTSWTTGLSSPTGVALTPDGKLVVADTNDDRILIWNTFPTRDLQPADLVLGVADPSIPPPGGNSIDFTRQFPKPTHLSTDGSVIVAVTDYWNVMAFWQTFPVKSYANYPFEFDGSAGTPPVASNFRGASPLVVGGRFYLADKTNNRVLFWSAVPSSASGATAALGQADLMSGAVNGTGGMPGATTLNGPAGSPASDGTRLLVPDTGNNRVLIWNSLPSTNGAAADAVLGQDVFAGGSVNDGKPAPDLGGMSGPVAVAATASRIAVVDRGNNRVLLWSQPLTQIKGQKADLVLGQSSPSGAGANTGGVTASTMNGPQGVATDGTRLVVTDGGNNRVLIWNSWPTQLGQAADLILGQWSATNNAGRGLAASDTHFVAPVGVARAGSSLLVVDRDANRVLIYPTLPLHPTDPPMVVLGQPNFTSTSANSGGVSANGLSGPRMAASDGTALAVADTQNHRVLLWRSLPQRNQQAADLVLGQNTLAANGMNAGGVAKGLNGPCGVFIAGGRLYVADSGNNRVLIWKSLPTVNQQAADVVLGQADLNGAGAPAMASASSLKNPVAVVADATSIYVTDNAANRVLVWKTLEPTNGQPADLVLAQPNLTSDGAVPSPSGAGMSNPLGISVYQNRLYAVDNNFNRVLYFDPLPTQSGTPAIGVLGQPDITSGAINNGGVTAQRLYSPYSVLATEVGVYIADTNNGRVVVLPTPP